MDMEALFSFSTYLQSQSTAQSLLKKSYERLNHTDAHSKSYQNCHAFIYYLNHGLSFYRQGEKVPIQLQPILYFYGMVHLLKASLLVKRPDYPETTKLLAHGVSARKRKRKNYTFLEDQVKIQYNGLFPYFSKHLFSCQRLPTEPVKMRHLLASIPELDSLFTFEKQQKMINVGDMNSRYLTFPYDVLDHYHITEKAFIHRIKSHLPPIKATTSNEIDLKVELATTIKHSFVPFLFHFDKQHIYFPLERDDSLPMAEVMIHYLILYNLSMLSRYETEWWGDLLTTKPDLDYPFISQFLRCTARKIPLLLFNDLYQIHLE